MKIKGDMFGRFQKKARQIRDHATEIGTENVVLKGEIKRLEFCLEAVKRDRDALRTTVAKQATALFWKNVVLVIALVGNAAVTVVVIGRHQGWW